MFEIHIRKATDPYDRQEKVHHVERAIKKLREKAITENLPNTCRKVGGQRKPKKNPDYLKRLRHQYDKQLRDLPHSWPKK